MTSLPGLITVSVLEPRLLIVPRTSACVPADVVAPP
jgi:hypothetical protein